MNEFLERLLRPGDQTVDVGANLGVYTLFLAQLVGPTDGVIACEPDEQGGSVLRQNVLMNGA